MDSIVKLLLALIIGYCFVKLFCGCSVEGMDGRDGRGKKVRRELRELGEKIEEKGEEFLRGIEERYNPTPTPASNGVEVGNWIFNCPAGRAPSSKGTHWGCDVCPPGTYNDGESDDKCKQCPTGSVPITDEGIMGEHGSTDCMYCGYVGQWPFEGHPYTRSWSGPEAFGERYSNGIICQDCPENSSINSDVLKIPIPAMGEHPEGQFHLQGGRNINDCLCDSGYIKVPDKSGVGFTCNPCQRGTYPNKQRNENPDKCVVLGSADCPYDTFNNNDETCNGNNPCPTGQKQTYNKEHNYFTCDE